MVRVGIVEDDPEIRNAIKFIINNSEGYSCEQTYESAEEIINTIKTCAADVILMDINLPKKNGIEAVKELKRVNSTLHFIMLTVRDEHEYIFNALCAGACGYITKNTSPAKILDAIDEALNGGAPMSPSIARIVVQSFQQSTPSPSYDLTSRERDVLSLLCKGKAYKAISLALFISEETVRSHIRNIYKKLEVHSKSEAVAKAINNKIV